MKQDQSISQTNTEIYNSILTQLRTFFEKDTVKLVRYLHEERHMSQSAIARILGVTQQAVQQKYFPKKRRASK